MTSFAIKRRTRAQDMQAPRVTSLAREVERVLYEAITAEPGVARNANWLLRCGPAQQGDLDRRQLDACGRPTRS
jgi:hypothetical protein